MSKYIPHTEQCLRFGLSDDCPSCRDIEEKIEKKATEIS